MSFSPDGTRIFTADNGPTARVWDARTGSPLLELKDFARTGLSASFSPDGSRVVTCGWERTATLWDLRTGAPLLYLKGHMGDVRTVTFSPDGTRILTGSNDNTAKVWDARTGTPLLDLKGHTDGVGCASFSPDGTRIVTGSDDNTAIVWDAPTGMAPVELKGHTGAIQGSSFSPDGAQIATIGPDPTATVWDARTGKVMLELKGHSRFLTSVSFDSEGKRILTVGFTGGEPGDATVWDARTGVPLLTLKGRTEIDGAAFSPDGLRIVTGESDGAVTAWDSRTGKALLDFERAARRIQRLSFSVDGTRVVVRIGSNSVTVWDAETGQELKGEPIRPIPRPGEISPDGRWIAHTIEDRVELIPLQPDEPELAYRRSQTQPNLGRYREGYVAAIEAKDAFAARFYLSLFSPREPALVRAEEIVEPLFARLLLRVDVLAALTAQSAADPEIQAACVQVAETWPESAEECNNAAWDLVRKPWQARRELPARPAPGRGGLSGQPRGRELRQHPGRGPVPLRALGRGAGNSDAVKRPERGENARRPGLLALAQHRLRQFDQARGTLGRFAR